MGDRSARDPRLEKKWGLALLILLACQQVPMIPSYRLLDVAFTAVFVDG
jgi:hypothetical protein